MMNAHRKQPSERPEQARGNGFLQRWRRPRSVVRCDERHCLIEQPHLERFYQ